MWHNCPEHQSSPPMSVLYTMFRQFIDLISPFVTNMENVFSTLYCVIVVFYNSMQFWSILITCNRKWSISMHFRINTDERQNENNHFIWWTTSVLVWYHLISENALPVDHITSICEWKIPTIHNGFKCSLLTEFFFKFYRNASNSIHTLSNIISSSNQ